MNCENCGKALKGRQEKYCSRQCKAVCREQRLSGVGDTPLCCQKCGKELSGNRVMFCSNQCQSAHRAEHNRRKETIVNTPPYIIYGLQDPVTLLIRYVGMTNSPDRRFRQHLEGTQGTSAKNRWLVRLRQKQLVPDLIVLETAEDEQAAKEVERRWIKQGRELGWPLTNAVGIKHPSWLSSVA